MRKVILTAMGMVAMGAATPALADVKAGVDAWSRGDYKAAVDQWRGPAVAGDADAAFNLGQAYKLGRGVPLDPTQAESWFRKAAMQGHQQAEDNYGLALYQDQKLSDAVPWLEKSVARGEPRAQLVLGTMLFNGDGVGRDYPRAYALMTRASAQGLASASETLAQMDQYISPADREKGTALAQQYAAKTGVMPRPVRDPALVATRPAMRPVDAPQARIMPSPARPPVRPMPMVATAPVAAAPVATAPVHAAPVHAAPVRPAPAKAEPSHGGWRIQLGAFRDRGNAEALWTKVRGHMAGAEPTYVKAGAVTRLLAGGFASKAEAQHACAAAGTACVVVAP